MKLTSLAALLCLWSACVHRLIGDDALQPVARAILERYAHQADAYRRKDVDAFMENLEPDFTARTLDGASRTREMTAAAVSAQMNRVEDPDITVTIDSLFALPRTARAPFDSVEVFSAQRYVRRVRDDAGVMRTVNSSQRHREHWRRTPRGWRIYFLQELAGEQ